MFQLGILALGAYSKATHSGLLMQLVNNARCTTSTELKLHLIETVLLYRHCVSFGHDAAVLVASLQFNDEIV